MTGGWPPIRAHTRQPPADEVAGPHASPRRTGSDTGDALDPAAIVLLQAERVRDLARDKTAPHAAQASPETAGTLSHHPERAAQSTAAPRPPHEDRARREPQSGSRWPARGLSTALHAGILTAALLTPTGTALPPAPGGGAPVIVDLITEDDWARAMAAGGDGSISAGERSDPAGADGPVGVGQSRELAEAEPDPDVDADLLPEMVDVAALAVEDDAASIEPPAETSAVEPAEPQTPMAADAPAQAVDDAADATSPPLPDEITSASLTAPDEAVSSGLPPEAAVTDLEPLAAPPGGGAMEEVATPEAPRLAALAPHSLEPASLEPASLEPASLEPPSLEPSSPEIPLAPTVPGSAAPAPAQRASVPVATEAARTSEALNGLAAMEPVVAMASDGEAGTPLAAPSPASAVLAEPVTEPLGAASLDAASPTLSPALQGPAPAQRPVRDAPSLAASDAVVAAAVATAQRPASMAEVSAQSQAVIVDDVAPQAAAQLPELFSPTSPTPVPVAETAPSALQQLARAPRMEADVALRPDAPAGQVLVSDAARPQSPLAQSVDAAALSSNPIEAHSGVPPTALGSDGPAALQPSATPAVVAGLRAGAPDPVLPGSPSSQPSRPAKAAIAPSAIGANPAASANQQALGISTAATAPPALPPLTAQGHTQRPPSAPALAAPQLPATSSRPVAVATSSPTVAVATAPPTVAAATSSPTVAVAKSSPTPIVPGAIPRRAGEVPPASAPIRASAPNTRPSPLSTSPRVVASANTPAPRPSLAAAPVGQVAASTPSPGEARPMAATAAPSVVPPAAIAAVPGVAPAGLQPAAPTVVAALPPAAAIAAPPPTAPSVMIAREAALAEQIATLISGTACAGLRTDLALNESIATVSGPIATQDAWDALRDDLLDLDGIDAVRDEDIVVAGEGLCDLLDFVRGSATLAGAAFIGAPQYVQGERVRLTYQMPDFDTYLYVDYFADGTVTHIVPTPDTPPMPLAAQSWLEIGGDETRQLFVYPPFGVDAILVVASAVPLFDRERPGQEAATPYLDELAARLRQNDRRQREIQFMLLRTSPGPGFSAGVN